MASASAWEEFLTPKRRRLQHAPTTGESTLLIGCFRGTPGLAQRIAVSGTHQRASNDAFREVPVSQDIDVAIAARVVRTAHGMDRILFAVLGIAQKQTAQPSQCDLSLPDT